VQLIELVAVRVAYVPLAPKRTCCVPENEQVWPSLAQCFHVVVVAANDGVEPLAASSVSAAAESWAGSPVEYSFLISIPSRRIMFCGFRAAEREPTCPRRASLAKRFDVRDREPRPFEQKG
jgi:hypothetical protein